MRKLLAVSIVALITLTGCQSDDTVRVDVRNVPLPTATQTVEPIIATQQPSATPTTNVIPPVVSAPKVTRQTRPVKDSAPVVTRGTRPVKPKPIVVGTPAPPSATAPIIAPNPRPVQPMPSVVTSAPPTATGPVVTRQPRPIADPPTVVAACPEEDPESCAPQTTTKLEVTSTP